MLVKTIFNKYWMLLKFVSNFFVHINIEILHYTTFDEYYAPTMFVVHPVYINIKVNIE